MRGAPHRSPASTAPQRARRVIEIDDHAVLGRWRHGGLFQAAAIGQQPQPMLGRALVAPGAAKNLLDLSQGLRERRAAATSQRAHAQVAAGPRRAGWQQQLHALAAEAEQGHVIASF